MINELFESALGVKAPWYIRSVDFQPEQKKISISIDFKSGSRFPYPDYAGEHPAYDTQTKTYRHLNFFQYHCELVVRVPRVKLPDGKIRLIEPEWSGQLNGFTLMFEAFVMLIARNTTFAACAEIAGITWHQAHAICEKYVNLAIEQTDLSALQRIAVDETSCRKGHDYLTVVADMEQRRVAFVTPGKDANTLNEFTTFLESHKGDPEQINTVSIDMSPAFIKGVKENMPNAEITFDKFHVIAHASEAVDRTRRAEQKLDPDLKGMRWPLLKGSENLTPDQQNIFDSYRRLRPSSVTLKAWAYREELRAILERKQPNVLKTVLQRWCTGVMRSKVDEMKKVAKMIRSHIDGIVAWARSRQTNGFIEAINGLFQAAKRKARGYTRFGTMKTVIFLIAGKLDFLPINPHLANGALV